MDLIASIRNFASTWFVPKGAPHTWQALGNTQTCKLSGALGHGGQTASVLYTGSLCLYFFLVIRCGWHERRIKTVEPFFHAVPLTIGWGTAMAGVFLDLYHPFGWCCWIVPHGDMLGESAFVYRWLFYYMWLWMVLTFCAVAMYLIYSKLAETESSSRRLGQPSGGGLASKFATQALLYIGACLIATIFPMLQTLTHQLTGQIFVPFLFLITIFFPLQGFFNAAIYTRPRYLKYRKEVIVQDSKQRIEVAEASCKEFVQEEEQQKSGYAQGEPVPPIVNEKLSNQEVCTEGETSQSTMPQEQAHPPPRQGGRRYSATRFEALVLATQANDSDEEEENGTEYAKYLLKDNDCLPASIL